MTPEGIMNVRAQTQQGEVEAEHSGIVLSRHAANEAIVKKCAFTIISNNSREAEILLFCRVLQFFGQQCR